LGSLTSKTKRDFGEKTSDKYIFRKSHFADEERLRKNHSRTKRKFGGKYILVKSRFEDEERLRGNAFEDEERLREKIR
jgi:hypothetical protein